jgi:hypothetical protein
VVLSVPDPVAKAVSKFPGERSVEAEISSAVGSIWSEEEEGEEDRVRFGDQS